MRDFNWYVETAKQKNNLKSLRSVARELEITQSAFHGLVHKHSNPSDETMIKLAKLAGVEPSIALVERNVWMSSGEPKTAYAKILHTLQHATLAIFLAVVGITGLSTDASASPALSNDKTNNIYYGK
jgi:plasmid maintenance system antidote protein VapI